MADEERTAHLKSAGISPKCGTSEAAVVTNWVLGATFREVYVPADLLQRADRVCERCQDAALADDSGSDDEVVPDDEDVSAEAPLEDDPAFAEISDQRLLRELARRLGDEAGLAQEQSDEPEQRRG